GHCLAPLNEAAPPAGSDADAAKCRLARQWGATPPSLDDAVGLFVGCTLRRSSSLLLEQISALTRRTGSNPAVSTRAAEAALWDLSAAAKAAQLRFGDGGLVLIAHWSPPWRAGVEGSRGLAACRRRHLWASTGKGSPTRWPRSGSSRRW